MALSIALITHNDASPGADNARIKTLLEGQGHTVTHVDTQDFNGQGSGYAAGLGYDCCLVCDDYSFSGSSGVSELRAQTIPIVIAAGSPAHSDFLFGTGTSDLFSKDVDITDATDPVAVQGGWSSGVQSWSLASIAEVTGKGSGVTVFGEIATTLEDVFLRADLGDDLTSGTAPELRLWLGLYVLPVSNPEDEEEVYITFIEAVETYLASGALLLRRRREME